MRHYRNLSCNSLAAVLLFLAGFSAFAEDWPTYRHDNRRSGATAEQLDLAALELRWAHEPALAPIPAWHGPAKWDAYAERMDLRSMRNYDPVYYVSVAGDAVYYGSSSEDEVLCLDAAKGTVKWRYAVDGPVRVAPAIHDGRVYFGADDGAAYCLRAEDGTLLWRVKPSEEDRFIPNNGKLISLHPCRTGVLVDDGKAYFGASLLPWNPSYLCAVDAATGRSEGEALFSRTVRGVTMEGAMLASPTKLYVMQGRSTPMVFARESGKRRKNIQEAGGVFAILTPDKKLVHGPKGQKEDFIALTDAETQDVIASFERGNFMIVTETHAYVLRDAELLAVDRGTKKTLWTVPCDCPLTLILAGDTLLAGGKDKVRAYASGDGQMIAVKEVAGRAYGLAVANGALYVSTDTGAIYSFR